MSLFFTVITLSAVAAVTFAVLPANYQSLSAAKKQEVLWDKISADPYKVLPTEGHNAFESLQLMKSNFDQKAFTWDGDEMIKDRPKLVHTYGAAAKTEIQIDSTSPYTGIFAPGTKRAISRMSLAVNSLKLIAPGFATKVLVDGKPSVDLFALNGVDGQGSDNNVFKLPFSNFIPDPAGLPAKLLASRFREAKDDLPGGDCDRPSTESKLPLLFAASQHVNGSVKAKPRAPATWHLTPNPEVGWDGTQSTDFRAQLAKIPVDTVLYTISTAAVEGGPKEPLGKIVLKSPFVASDYEDSQLFFKHPAKRC